MSVLPHLIGPCHHHASEQIRIHAVLRMEATRVRPRRHARKTQYAHQSLHPLAVDLVPDPEQVLPDLAAAVKRMPGVFRVNQSQQCQFLLVRFCGWVSRIDRGTRHTGQFTLPGQGQWFMRAHPACPRGYRHSPDFFLSQSSSILSRPISE